MSDLAFAEAERAFLVALDELSIRYLVVGPSAAVLGDRFDVVLTEIPARELLTRIEVFA